MPVTSPATAASLASQDAVEALLREVLPPQGAWSDEEYLWLTDRLRRQIELADGRIELLPMPTRAHQILLLFLYRVFHAHVQQAPRHGIVITSGLRMRVRAGKFREPDLLLLRDRADPRNQDRFWLGADLVAEVVSPDDPSRDLVIKRADYAEAGIHAATELTSQDRVSYPAVRQWTCRGTSRDDILYSRIKNIEYQ